MLKCGLYKLKPADIKQDVNLVVLIIKVEVSWVVMRCSISIAVAFLL